MAWICFESIAPRPPLRWTPRDFSRHTLSWCTIVCLAIGLAPAMVAAGGPLNFGLHTETMDGVNTFPTGAHVREDVHSSPFGPCGGTSSDLSGESSTRHYFVNEAPFVDTPLPTDGCMDIRELWIAWDLDFLYLGVQGPNELYERGDLFIAIDTDNNTAPGVHLATAPWAKSVDFCGWDPEFFIALEAPKTSGFGYAALLDQSFGVIRDSGSGLLWDDGAYVTCSGGGMYYEFAIPLADLGLAAMTAGGQAVNFALYATYEDDGFDTYDTGPGCGNAIVWEELGDVPFDGDHCSGNLDCVTDAEDPSCGFAESDDGLGAGNSINGRFPASDNSPSDIDTIQEYYAITNIGNIPTVAIEHVPWSVMKYLFR